MTHITKRTSRAIRLTKSSAKDVPLSAAPFDQHAPADIKRDRRLIADLTNNSEIDRIARLRKETTATESEADGVLSDHDQLEAEAAHAPNGIAPDPAESEIID
jgi:hypothetical protein